MSPSLKSLGIPRRARLFEVVQRVKDVNNDRQRRAPGHTFSGSSSDIHEPDEMSYRQKLWAHQPITDFWRVGRGYARRLEKMGLYTMGDIARCCLSSYGENQLYKEFGINAELLMAVSGEEFSENMFAQ